MFFSAANNAAATAPRRSRPGCQTEESALIRKTHRSGTHTKMFECGRTAGLSERCVSLLGDARVDWHLGRRVQRGIFLPANIGNNHSIRPHARCMGLRDIPSRSRIYGNLLLDGDFV